MNMKKTLAICMVAAMVCSLAAQGQDSELTSKPAGDSGATSRPDKPTRTAVEIAQDMEFQKQKFLKIVMRMTALAKELEASDQSTSRILSQAVAQAQRALIANDMEQAMRNLREGFEQAAKKAQGDVSVKLDLIRSILAGTEVDPETRKKELEDLKDLHNKVAEILKKELGAEVKSRGEQLKAEAEKISKQLEDIVAKQKDILDQTQKNESSDPGVKKLADLSEQLGKMIKDQAAIRDESDQAESRQQPVVGKKQESLSGKADELANKIKDAAADKSVADAMSKAQGDTKPIKDASAVAAKAADEMKKAAESLGKGEGKDASSPNGSQQKAIEKLNEAKQAIDQAVAAAGAKTQSGQLGSKQSELAKQTEDLGKAIDKLAKSAGLNADGSTSKPAGDSTSKPAGDSSSKPAGDSSSKPAGDSSSKPAGDSSSKPSGDSSSTPSDQSSGKPSDESAGQQGQDSSNSKSSQSSGDKSDKNASKKSSPSSPQSDNVKKASEHMEKAADKLNKQDSPAATDEQKAALERLEKKKAELAQLQKKIKEKVDASTEQQKKEQDDIQKDTDSVSDDMKKSGTNKPGQEAVSNASKSMGQASGNLSQGKSSDANQNQNEAIKELQKAKDELAEAIEKTEEELAKEKLLKIEQMLQKILDTQKGYTKTTKDVYGRRDGTQYNRQDELTLTNTLSNGEGKLKEEVEKVLELLKKDGTTTVFPEVLGKVSGDLKDVQTRLAAKDAGTTTQLIQQEIEQNLQDLIDAVTKQLSKQPPKKGGPSGGGGGGGGGGGPKPLVPPIAELRMLRTMELQLLNRNKQMIADQQAGKGVDAEKLKEEYGKLEQRQAKVAKLAEEINEKMKKEEAGNE